MTKGPSCCKPAEKKGKGLLAGILYGLAPHTFCIAFIVFSVVGASAAAGLLRQVLLAPYLFQLMIALSFVFATLSALFYLRRSGNLSLAGARSRWRYLTVLYSTTVAVNLLLFLVVFPAVANTAPRVQAQGLPAATGQAAQPASMQTVVLKVELPCSGHAPLVTDDLLKQEGIINVRYELPDRFSIDYDPARVTVERIMQFEIFEEFPAQVAS